MFDLTKLRYDSSRELIELPFELDGRRHFAVFSQEFVDDTLHLNGRAITVAEFKSNWNIFEKLISDRLASLRMYAVEDRERELRFFNRGG